MSEIDDLKTDLDNLNEEIRLLKLKVNRLERVVITQNIQIKKLTDITAKLLASILKAKGGVS